MSSKSAGGIFGLEYRTEDRIFRSFLYASAVIIIGIGIFPLYWIGQLAFTRERAIMADLSWFPSPETFTLENFGIVAFGDVGLYFINSIIVTMGTVIIVVLISLLAGYGLARLKFGYKENFARFLLFGYMFSPIVLALPLYLIYDTVGLLNTHIGLMLTLATISMPFAVWLMWKYIQTIPESMEESAWVVGASRWRAFWDVIIPQCRPAIVAAALFAFAISWADFTFAQILLPANEMTTFPPGIMEIVNSSYNTSWGEVMAALFLMSLPCIAFAYFLQDYLLEGFEVQGL